MGRRCNWHSIDKLSGVESLITIMKVPLNFSALGVAATTCLLLLSFTAIAQDAETRRENLRTDIVWGVETNGLKAGISLRWWPSVYLFLQNSSTNVASILTHPQKANSTVSNPSDGPEYYNPDPPVWLGATDGFLGPMELRDASGIKVPLLRTGVNDLGAYPDSLRWSILESQMSHVTFNQLEMNIAINVEPAGSVKNPARAYFQVKDYFHVRETGEYQLTVWPKIYKRSENTDTNRDIFRRIDIPPVTVTVKCNGKPVK